MHRELGDLRDTLNLSIAGIYRLMWAVLISFCGGTLLMAGVMGWALVRKGAGL